MNQKSDSIANNAAELFEPPKLAVDKLPQLRTLFERASAGCVENYKELFTAPVACFLNQVEAGDSWDILDGFENCIAALFYVSEWDAQILIALEKRLLATMTDAMFGGDGSEAPSDAPHSLSVLDLQIARDVFERTARCLSAAFSPLSDIQISFERIETDIEFSILGPQNIPSVFAQLLFQVFDHGGRMFVVIPRAPLLPLRKKLERATLRAAQAEDPRWTSQLQSRVATTNVAIRATADGPPMTLGQVSQLRVGQILPIEAAAGTEIILESGSTAMFRCSLGQLEGWFSIKVDTPIGPPKGLMENVISEAMRGWGATAAETKP